VLSDWKDAFWRIIFHLKWLLQVLKLFELK